MNNLRKAVFFCSIICLFAMNSGLGAQEIKEIGGEPLEHLKKDFKERFIYYTFDYLRMYKTYSKDNTFADYLNDGNEYTIFAPVEEAMEMYYSQNGGRNGNIPRLRNTMKYNMVKGKMLPEDFKNEQKLRTIYGSGSYIDVIVKKGKITLKDMQGNSVKLSKPMVFEKVVIYPLDVCLRYQ